MRRRPSPTEPHLPVGERAEHGDGAVGEVEDARRGVGDDQTRGGDAVHRRRGPDPGSCTAGTVPRLAGARYFLNLVEMRSGPSWAWSTTRPVIFTLRSGRAVERDRLLRCEPHPIGALQLHHHATRRAQVLARVGLGVQPARRSTS